jgi:cytochrome c-type biogenesis protein
MFVALGMTATGLGSTLRDSKETLDTVAGILIVAMGVFFVLTPFVPRLNQEWRPTRSSAEPAPAARSSPAWPSRWRGRRASARRSPRSSPPPRRRTPSRTAACCWPSTRSGLAVPFLLTALAFDRATTAFGWIREHYLLVTALSGCVLILMGTLILTGELTQLNVQAQKALSNLGLDFLYKV